MRGCAFAAMAVLGLAACAGPGSDLERETRALLERKSWPATSVLVLEGNTFRLNLGHRTPQGHDPQDLVYPLGSISKMFTAAALHRLAERGEVDLQAPVAQYLADWPPAWHAVRVHQLLGHTSGVPDFWFVPQAAKLVAVPAARAADLARVMAREPLQFDPGSRFSYSNTAYQAAARIVEQIAAVSYDVYLTREFFTPLGMASMHHCRGSSEEVNGHVLRGGTVEAIAPENYETARGDGGLCGSARDLARWFRAMAGGSLTRAPAWQAYTSPQRLTDGTVVPYGHGISLRPLADHRKLGHHGAMTGHTGMVAWYPERDLVIVVLTSIGGVSADAVEQAIAAMLLDVDTPRPLDGNPPAVHAGRFDVGPFVLEVRRRNGALEVVSPPPGPNGHLVRVGPAIYALDGDPWGVALHMDCAGEQCPRMRLHMAGMEWPGRRVDP
ncbi:Penicillin-binding protein E [Luteitalea pratensis]|uniref:Penicillin-binding protein E n=1 Tax=Luteitalea pratensis TaxID=1855912 RepID=A0A143PGY2_LUTPR|nr:serine hydrolase domain-containing protein [Luteitalea pratensis]AMY07024.1 Penicillin-binding protein E [Luteitalea pratensis]